MSDQVLFEAKDNVALLTLNRPEKLNALSYEVNDLLMKLLDGVEDDDSIRARSRFQLVDSRSTDFSPIVMNGLFDDSCLKSIWSSAQDALQICYA